MNPVLLDLVYAGGLLATSPYFLYKMATTGKYRSGLSQRLGNVTPRDGAPCIWLHGVSVGEILAARSIVSQLEKDFPEIDIALSTTTNTGFADAGKTYPDKRVFYFTFDFSWAVARTFDKITPRLVLLMEMEAWPNFLSRARQLGVPVVVANGRITERSYRRFSRFPTVARATLSKVSLYLVQTDDYAAKLVSLGVPAERVTVTGSVKFDTISTDADPDRRAALRAEMGVAPNETLLIGGSTHAAEEDALLDAYVELKSANPHIRLLIVPRHRTRFEEVARLIASRGFDVLARSTLDENAPLAPGEILLADTMGELEALYEASDVAFVGGSLIPHGGQNMAEPAAKGKPVVFGPSVDNFPQAAKLLLDASAATQVDSAQGLAAALGLYLDADNAARAGAAGRDAVIAAKGATARTVEAIAQYLQKDNPASGHFL